MQRRKSSREFKIEAVRLVRERGVSVATHSLQIHAVGPANRRRTSTWLLPQNKQWMVLIEPQGLNEANSSRSELLTIR
jgi:hypothetical protein